jgi:hypothetical protein
MSSDPFKTIWTSPRETVRRIVTENPELHVVQLTCLSGVMQVLDRASMRNAGDQLPVPAIFGIALVLGPLSGLFSVWIFSHLCRLAGSWIGGTAPREHIKAAIAWSSVPVICSLALWIPQLALFGSELFTAETPRIDSQSLPLTIAFIGLGVVELVLGVWTMVLLCQTLAEVQGYSSAWRGLGNIALALAIVVVPLVIVGLTFAFMARS